MPADTGEQRRANRRTQKADDRTEKMSKLIFRRITCFYFSREPVCSLFSFWRGQACPPLPHLFA